MRRYPLKLFYSYASEDVAHRETLEEHLEVLVKEGIITPWHDGKIIGGKEWFEVILENMRTADIILLLISDSFLSSEFVSEHEIPLALERHDKGDARVVPILLEDVKNLYEQSFSKLEILPTKAQAISGWDDSTKAFLNIAEEIRKVANDFVWDRGGPFEPRSHIFKEAELARLDKDSRSRATERLDALREQLNKSVPKREPESNLLIATWCLRKFGQRSNKGLLPETLFYMAQIISAFDLVALQEVDRNITRLRELLEILGPDWGYVITDITEGVPGNNERFAVLYYRPRVTFENVSGEVVLLEKELIDGKQFARKPLIASFRWRDFQFRLCTAHFRFGGKLRGRPTLLEAKRLAGHLARKAKRDNLNMILAGDFNMSTLDSSIIEEFRGADFYIPNEILHPSNIKKTKYYDMFAFILNEDKFNLDEDRPPNSGAVDFTESVFRDQDRKVYEKLGAISNTGTGHVASGSTAERRYQTWITYQMSDHLPLWVELKKDMMESRA